MRNKPLVTIATIAVAATLGLSACSGDPGEETGTEEVTAGFREAEASGDPTTGGTLTLADYAEVRTLDPTKVFATGYSGGSALVAVYDQLVRWNERTQEFEPRLAESLEPNDDYTEWTLTLREGVTFSDGSALDADAVIGSFEYYLANQGYDLSVVGPLWGGATKVDDRTITITLTDSWASFPFALGQGMGFIVAPAAIADGPENFTPIGAGAFTYDNYRPSEELVLSANPEYWDGAPYLDELRFVWLGSDETKLDSRESGAVQAAVYRDAETIGRAYRGDDSGWVKFEPLGNSFNINLNEERPGHRDDVRQAIALAIDPEDVYERAFNGEGMPTKLVFGPESQWYNEDAEAPPTDPEQAAELVEQARADGFDGKIQLTVTGTPTGREQGLALQAQLTAAGFEVETDFVRSVADFTTQVYVDMDFDTALAGVTMADDNPFWRLQEVFNSESWGNVYGYRSTEMDGLLAELRAADGEDRRDVLARIETLLLEDLPMVNLATGATFVAWDESVHGITPTNEVMLGFEKAWVE